MATPALNPETKQPTSSQQPPSTTQPTTTANTSSDSDSEEEEQGDFTLFREPADYYPPTPPPKITSYTSPSGTTTITLHLVGHSPLEAHHLWNGGRVVADLFYSQPSLVAGKTVFELGAGAGLPSLVAASLGAKKVVVTDYPDPELVEVMWKNVKGCVGLIPGVSEDEVDETRLNIAAEGYVWGADPGRVLQHLDDEDKAKGFDLLILADLLFRHSEHGNMLKSVRSTLKKSKDSRAYVVFTSYRPWLQHKDLAFFDLAREQGFVVEKVLEKKTERPLFEEDPGDEEVRKTVTGWTLRWPDEECEDAAK
ncbi:hypothetical protein VTJ04DRAFT_6694 [Mycothermus thermophilus]|uniref:uncharacterized protein n=1 Tax=Humicola insolens TaxID=85995 RepID=UPI0037448997